MRNILALATIALVLISLSAEIGTTVQQTAYERSTLGTRWLESPGGGTKVKMLVEEANLGGAEVEIGEITFPAGHQGGDHLHQSTEIFYILSGTLIHVVNGAAHELTPGMVGIVRAGDEVAHRVPAEAPSVALVIWTPGGEAGRLEQIFTERPLR